MLRSNRVGIACALGLLSGAATSPPALAAELRVLGGSAIETAIRELIPAFERRTGHTVSHDLDGAIGQMTARVRDGEHADVVIVSREHIDALARGGRIMPRSEADLAKVAIGIFVRASAPKPDIGTVEAFRRTMLAARSIGWNDPAAGAPVSLYMIDLFERLGIAAQMQPKTVAFKQRSERFAAVARGDVEIGFNQVSEIIAAPGVDLVGPLPDDIQNYTRFSAGIGVSTREPAAARAFVDFMASKDAMVVWTAKGFQPP
jgi:molybdate transport system substrate-binding protein